MVLTVAACGRTGVYDVRVREGGDELVQDWTEIAGSATGGGISHHGADALCDRVAVDSQGRVYVAWVDPSSGVDHVYLRRYAGAWESLAGSGDGAGVSVAGGARAGTNQTCLGGLAFDPNDRPYLAWQQFSGTSQPIYLRYWDGSGWSELGASASATGISGAGDGWWPSVLADGDGPIVGYEQQGNVLVRRWSGAWVGVGNAGVAPGLNDVPGESHVVSLARDGEGRLLAVWTADGATDYDIRVSRFDGASWEALGASVGHSATHYQATSVIAAGDTLYAAWNTDDTIDSPIHVARFVAGQWQALPDPGRGWRTAMAVDTTNRPVIVWAQLDTMGQNIHGARWNDSRWESLDGPRGSISNETAAADLPAIAIGDDGTTYVTWLQSVGAGVTEIYGRVMRPE